MKKIQFEGLKVPVYLFSDEKDKEALEQVFSLARTHIPDGHIALMPDYHLGYGVPIGTVFASERFVVPNAVGVDIGCGVYVIETSLNVQDFMEKKEKICESVFEAIPTGFKWNKKCVQSNIYLNMPLNEILIREKRNSQKQLGTLGGGNHFIEFQKDSSGKIYIMLHCGSRNLGKQVADHYHGIAFSMLKKDNPNDVPADLAFLEINSNKGREYLNSMNFCVLFAKENRRLIGEKIIYILKKYFKDIEYDIFDVNHNFANMEIVDDKRLLVHRKGALSANKGEKVVIPGSMGSSSYILSGKGNTLSFCSCSHGAGRSMSRKKAKQEFSSVEVITQLNNKSITVYTENKKFLPEESEFAYKDIEKIIALQKDLVEVIKRVHPVAVIKG